MSTVLRRSRVLARPRLSSSSPPAPPIRSARDDSRTALPRCRRLAGPRAGRLRAGDGRRRNRARGQHPAPIASLAKVMTAYLVLQQRSADARRPGSADRQPGRCGRHRSASRARRIGRAGRARRGTHRTAGAGGTAAAVGEQRGGHARAPPRRQRQRVRRADEPRRRALGMRNTTYTDPSGYWRAPCRPPPINCCSPRSPCATARSPARRHRELRAACRRHRPQHRRVARHARFRRHQDRFGRRGRRLLHVPRAADGERRRW